MINSHDLARRLLALPNSIVLVEARGGGCFRTMEGFSEIKVKKNTGG